LKSNHFAPGFMVLSSFAYKKINLSQCILFTYMFLKKLFEIKIGVLYCYSEIQKQFKIILLHTILIWFIY